jgi:hypothetical protein
MRMGNRQGAFATSSDLRLSHARLLAVYQSMQLGIRNEMKCLYSVGSYEMMEMKLKIFMDIGVAQRTRCFILPH